jgi:hypothetical protein
MPFMRRQFNRQAGKSASLMGKICGNISAHAAEIANVKPILRSFEDGRAPARGRKWN